MSNFEPIDATKLKQILEKRNLWSRICTNKLLSKKQARASARIPGGGISKIVSYYDEHLQYVCTIHKIITPDGKISHEHVKDAYIDGVRYKAQ